MPTKPTERAVLIVSGNQFKDWETVQVIHQLYAPFFAFRFTCSEGQPLAGHFSKLQIKPGDQCQITLAGQPAFEGEVTERQVFYDARRHHIQISGKSHAEKLTHASVTSKTGEFNKVTFEQLCRRKGVR
jgi:prophage tail gpP-like protein